MVHKSLKLICLLLAAWNQLTRCGPAAPPPAWEVIRIYVREDEVGSLVPQDYSPVEIEDLRSALKREDVRRSQKLLDSPRIADAIYVAQCSLDALGSTQSRWQVSSPQADASLSLGVLSCALKNAAVVPADDQSLVKNLRFTVDGQSTLSGIGPQSTYWFGFSCSPTKSANHQSIFEMRLPAATFGRLLLAAPENIQLSSPDVVVKKITDPRLHLPTDWPSLPAVENCYWYLLHVSGRDSFRVVAESTNRKDAFAFQQFVRSANLTYDVSSAGLDVTGEFALERIDNSKLLELRLSQALRVKKITLDDVPVDWQITSSGDATTHVIALVNGARTARDCRLNVECVGSLEFPFAGALPFLGVEQGFAWSGTTNLRIDEDFIVEEVLEAIPNARAGGWYLSSAPTSQPAAPLAAENLPGATSPAPVARATRKMWTTNWTGVTPRTEASLSRVDYPWQARSFTRLTLQPNWIAAAAHLELSAKQLKSNELRLRLGDGWLVDGLTIEQSTFPVNFQLPDGETREITLNWERLSEEMTIHLRVAAHLSQNTEVDKLLLQAPRVVSAPGADQSDVYAIEPIGRFRIQSDPQIQRLLLRSADLAPWQSQLLTQPDSLLLQGVRGTIPPLVLKRSSGTYTTSIQTIATPEGAQLRAEYSVEVQPVSGAIDRVTCLLNIPDGVTAPAWSLLRDDDRLPLLAAQSAAPATRVELDNSVAVGETFYELQLPEPTAEKFTLRTEIILPIDVKSAATVPLLSSPGAVSTDAILALPRRFSLLHSSAGIESLPGSICCSAGELSSLLGSLGSSMVAYRYDSSSVSSVDIRILDADTSVRNWVWSDKTDHRLYNDGLVSHTCEWQIFAPESGECSIELPPGWILDRLLFDGEPVEISRQTPSQKIGITLPRSEHIQLKVYCVSYIASPSWLTKVEIARPRISLGSLHSSQWLWLQPSKLSLADLKNAPGPSLPADLLPGRWWKWLAPDFIHCPALDGDTTNREDLPPQPQRWRAVEIASDFEDQDRLAATGPDIIPTSNVYLIDRAALSGLSVALLLAGASLTFLFIGTRTWLWWSLITLTLASISLVPAYYAIVAHLLLLCLVCGAVARLVHVVVNSRGSNHSPFMPHGSTLQRRTTTVAVWLVASLAGTTASAQVVPPEENLPTPTNVFGVIIPLNKQGELSAKHVYAPRKLMNLLENPDAEDSLSQPPEILGSKYTLKLRGGTSLTTSYVQEFTAEFEVQFDSSDADLQLPFSANQVQLLRGFVFGQEVYIGSRLKQTADSITYFPDEPGRVRLRLQLIPKQFEIEDRTALDITIPPIASATLEVLTDDSLDVRIAGKGEVRRATLTSWEADLGPVGALKLDWPTRPQRTPSSNQSQVYADTWLQIQNRQLMADCQLRIEGAAALPKQLHLIVDAGWEPVGTLWNDVQLISSELSAIGNRRIYTVTRAEQADATIARVLLVPRNLEAATTMNLPFFSLQENSLASRTLAIATSLVPGWKVTGADSWNRLSTPAAELQWDASKLAQSASILRVPSGAIGATLQRAADPISALVAESNVVTFLNSESLISYRAVWPQANVDRPVLTLQVPPTARAKNVQVNGLDVDYQLVRRDANQLLIVSIDNSRALQQLDVKLTQTTRLGKLEWLPRVVLEDTPVISSDYQVRCGAELTCRFSGEQESGLVLPKPVSSPSEMLSSMASGIGRVELGSSFRDSPQLPLRFELAKRAAVKVEENAMLIARTEQGWKATVEAFLSSEGEPLEFAFFEIPAALRDLIEPGELPYSISSSVSMSRATLCILPKSAVAGKTRVAFDFRLPTVGSSQSISIPDIQLLVANPTRPVLALPNRIDGKLVRWSRAGRRLHDDWMKHSSVTFAPGDFVFYQLGENQLQTSWTPATLESKRPEVLYASASLTEELDGSFVGLLDYWVEPQNLLELVAHLPPQCELVGIQTGGSSAVWSTSEEGRPAADVPANRSQFIEVRILMQPNYLPVHLRFFVRWQASASWRGDKKFSLRLPTLEANGFKELKVAVSSVHALSGVTLAVEPRIGGAAASLESNAGDDTTYPLVVADIADRWKSLLLKALPTVSDLKADELSSWLKDWSPQVVGLSDDHPLTLSNDSAAGQDVRKYENVAEFWNWYLQQVDSGERDLVNSLGPLVPSFNQQSHEHLLNRFANSPGLNENRLPMNWFTTEISVATAGNSLSLGVIPVVSRQIDRHHVTAAVFLCLTSSLIFWLSRRLRNFGHDLLAARPWVYWAFLAALAWLILPVIWPSLIVACSAVSLFFSQFLSSRRRNYSSRPA